MALCPTFTEPTIVGGVVYAGAPLLIVWFTTAIAGEAKERRMLETLLYIQQNPTGLVISNMRSRPLLIALA